MATTLVHSGTLAAYVSDIKTGEILMANDVMCQLLKKEKSDVIGGKCWMLCNPSQNGFCEYCPREHLLDDDGMPSTPHALKYYNELLHAWVFLVGHAAFWSDGRVVQIITIQNIINITPESAVVPATKSRNTRLLTGKVPELIECTVDTGKSWDSETVCVMDYTLRIDLVCIDLSDLKLIRTAFGWETGQALLEVMLKWIAGMDFDDASLYHVDGDSYCLAIRDADADKVMCIARGLRTRFSQPWLLPKIYSDMPLFCSAKISVAHIPNGLLPGSNLADIANRAIGSAKHHADIFVHDAEADLREHRQLRLEASLKSCVNDGMQCFHVEYQPIVRLSNGIWSGFEALCRWDSPEFGDISPATFIPSAERQGLIAEIGLWVLEQAVRDAKEFGLDEVDDFFLSVNVSPLQLLDRNFPDQVSAILRRHRYPGKRLLLEITESADVSFDSNIQSSIEQMRWIDVRMALDDFGTGYASFNNLRNLPVHFLKTECEFIRNIESNDATQHFFFAMSELSHANRVKLIAEGVETMGELAAIRESGADYGQGFLFARPMPKEELEHRLDEFCRANQKFPASSRNFHAMTNRLNNDKTYVTIPKALDTLNNVIEQLFSDMPLDESFTHALKMLGEQFRLGRAFVYFNMSNSFKHYYEWKRTGTGSALCARLSEYVPTAEQFDAFQSEGVIVIENTSSQRFRDAFAPFSLAPDHALALASMWDGDRLLGLLGFEYDDPGPWPQDILTCSKTSVWPSEASSSKNA